MAVLVIDEDAKLPRNRGDKRVLQREVMILNAVRELRPRVPVFLFQLGELVRNELNEIEIAEALPTTPVLVRAAGTRAEQRTKYAESCFSTKGGLALEQELDGIAVLVVAGRYHDSCVRATICDALAKGYAVLSASTIVAGDAHGPQDWNDDVNLEWYA